VDRVRGQVRGQANLIAVLLAFRYGRAIMARKPRVHFSGAFYHVMSRGNQGQKIFKDDRDRGVIWIYLGRTKSDLATGCTPTC